MKNFLVGLFVWITGGALILATVIAIVTGIGWLVTTHPLIAGSIGMLIFFAIVFGPTLVDEVIPAICATGKWALNRRNNS